MTTNLSLLPAQNIIADAELVAKGLPQLVAGLNAKLAQLDVSDANQIRDLQNFAKEKLKGAKEKRMPFTRHLSGITKIFTEPEGETETIIELLQGYLNDIAAKAETEKRQAEAAQQAALQAELKADSVGFRFQALLQAQVADHKAAGVKLLAMAGKDALSDVDTTFKQEDWAQLCAWCLDKAISDVGYPAEKKTEIFLTKIKSWLDANKPEILRAYKSELDAHVTALMTSQDFDAENLIANAEKQAEIETKQAEEAAKRAEDEAIIDKTLSASTGSVQVTDAGAVKVKVKKVAAPTDMAQASKLIAAYIASGEGDLDWFMKDCKKIITFANKQADKEIFVEGVNYVEEVKGK